jgi:hypothetical protein
MPLLFLSRNGTFKVAILLSPFDMVKFSFTR